MQKIIKYSAFALASYVGLVYFSRSTLLILDCFLKKEKLLMSTKYLIEDGLLKDENDEQIPKIKSIFEKLNKFNIVLSHKFSELLFVGSIVPYKIDDQKEFLYLITNRHCIIDSANEIDEIISDKILALIYKATNLLYKIFLWTDLSEIRINFENNRDLESILIHDQKPEILRSKTKDFAICKLKIDPSKKNLINDEFIKNNIPNFNSNNEFVLSKLDTNAYSVSQTLNSRGGKENSWEHCETYLFNIN